MICEVREKSVIIKKPTFGDIFAMIRLLVNPSLEIEFTPPVEE